MTNCPFSFLGTVEFESFCYAICMALHDDINELRNKRLQNNGSSTPNSLQGVSKEKINSVLSRVARSNTDTVDAVFALLDNETPSWFKSISEHSKFCDGASTAMVACHVGILQRGKGKLDREGRDYWLKPLWEIGAIEKVFLHEGGFIAGHPIAKSSNSAYRLAESFVDILRLEDGWESKLDVWISEDTLRTRLGFQAELAATAKLSVDTKHSDLIQKSIDYYVPRFLKNYQVIYVDDGDGDRITEVQRSKLKAAGVELTLADSMPDVLLWNEGTNWLWVLEAVTSDGEVDEHKSEQLKSLARRFDKPGIGFTTTYLTWRAASVRQAKHKNLCPSTYLWIAEDASRQFKVESFGE